MRSVTKDIKADNIKIKAIVDRLKRRYMRDFQGGEPFKVLISTVLSQRTRDENTYKASKKLFSVYKTIEELANAKEIEIQGLISEVGFHNVKARRVKDIARIISEEYDGNVPNDLKRLLTLPGVGRKTANCVLVYGFGIDAIPVDTHVHRVSNRMGLVKTRTPEQTEMELERIISREYWQDINELFIKFGRDVCKPINPGCDECFLNDLCGFGLEREEN